MKRIVLIFGSVLALGVLTWFFPLFRVVSTGHAQAGRQQAAFDAAEFARTFWDGTLRSSLERAADAQSVIEAIHENPRAARETFGRSVGLSRGGYYFLRGTATVVSVGPRGVGLSLRSSDATAAATEPDVLLLTGMLFGNTVRDATGLLDAGDFPNSQHYNAISAELNRIIETDVLPKLKEQAAVGQRIDFVGCAEVTDASRDLRPLKIVPVRVEIE